ncbi:MAG: hypothetical protein QOI24_1240 [Acidobacteriota bacterium]|nr:hypothetical protein [Acidobacteriota bacterium]
MFALKKVVMVCACGHSKRDHWCTKLRPQGTCLVSPCSAFDAEPICKCGHGKKAHAKGSCHEGDSCKEFRPTS